LNWGADAIYDIVDEKLEFRSHYKMPAPQLETENCVAHNGSIVPVPGRDIFVQAWYQGGISVIDFTDSSNPLEIAYFDRGPILEDELITGGYWSVYYYEGTIYGTEITRGLDALKLIPSEYLSENEIAAAAMAYPALGPRRVFNPQQQVPMTWPAAPEVARAYIDQLLRDNAITEDTAERIGDMLDQVTQAMDNGGNNRLARQINNYRLSATDSNVDALTRHRLEKLHAILKGIAAGLRG
jgi:hypothetical protein